VLVVDDNPSNRAVLMDLLRPIGFNLVEATDGGQAIERAQATRPDLILMDLRMPGIDGLEAARQLQQLPAMQGVPLIAVSASVTDDDQVLSQKIGFDAFLPKPIHWPRLAALLQEHLQLEWVYGEAANAARAALQVAGPLIPPPPEELAVLYEWARQGNLRALRERAADLETLGPHLLPFAHTLRDLARSYQTKAILTLIERYLTVEEAP
jgi:CheY-like chemotaxis protein